jgi:AbrB family looped-hinge helix DNA binding protein
MAEVVAATGGRRHNLLERLKARGYTVRRRKEGRTTRYWATPAGAPSYELTVTSKGQLTLPKPVRELLRIRDGEKLRVVIEGNRAVLDRKRVTIDDLYGFLHRPGMRARSIEEINHGIAEAAAKSGMRGLKRPKK